jgi:hypothetical protein
MEMILIKFFDYFMFNSATQGEKSRSQPFEWLGMAGNV